MTACIRNGPVYTLWRAREIYEASRAIRELDAHGSCKDLDDSIGFPDGVRDRADGRGESHASRLARRQGIEVQPVVDDRGWE